jgi:hypothetical protein
LDSGGFFCSKRNRRNRQYPSKSGHGLVMAQYSK